MCNMNVFFKKQFLPYKLADVMKMRQNQNENTAEKSLPLCTSGCTFRCDISKDTGQFPEFHSNLEMLFGKTERLEGRSCKGNKELA